jgi:hypothetical protein
MVKGRGILVKITASCSQSNAQDVPGTPFDELLCLIHDIDNNALRDRFIRWISINIGVETAHRRFHWSELSRLSHIDQDKAVAKAIRHMAAEIGTNIAKSGHIEIVERTNEPWLNIHAEFRYLKKG